MADYERDLPRFGAALVVGHSIAEATRTRRRANFDLAVIDLAVVRVSDMELVYALLPQPFGIVVVSEIISGQQAHELGRIGVAFLEKPAAWEALIDACVDQLAYARIARSEGRLALRVTTDRVERAVLLGALDRHDGCVTYAAESLGMDRSHYRRRARGLGIRLPSDASEPSSSDGTR